MAGTVTDAASGDPIEGAEVDARRRDRAGRSTTGADGTYSARLTAGDYTVTASAFGYETETATITVAAGDDVTQDFALDAAPTWSP